MGQREDICRAAAAASRRSSAAAYWLTSSATKRKLWSRRCKVLVDVNMSLGCIICCIKSALYTLYKRAIQAYTADAHCPARLVALCSVYSVLQRSTAYTLIQVYIVYTIHPYTTPLRSKAASLLRPLQIQLDGVASSLRHLAFLFGTIFYAAEKKVCL